MVDVRIEVLCKVVSAESVEVYKMLLLSARCPVHVAVSLLTPATIDYP